DLPSGNTDFFVRCDQCPRQYPNVPTVADRSLQLVYRNQDGSLTVLDEAKLDIRLFKEWATMYNVRSTPNPTNPDDYRPISTAQLSPGWADVPADAANLTVLVHGFHASESSAE